MGVIETRTFKSGNSVAVRLPKEFGFDPDIKITIAADGDGLHIRRVDDPDAGRQRVARLVAALRALGPAAEIEKREPFDFPERPGL